MNNTIDKHAPAEAAKLHSEARYKFRNHAHPLTVPYGSERDEDDEDLTRSNCGACALAGYGEVTDEGPAHPNYAGWERVYVQAGQPLPERYVEAFEDERVSTQNVRYTAALARDVATFGVPRVGK